MTVLVSDPDLTIHLGDVRDVLATLPDGSVDCVVTSPPYWGLRDYGVGGQIGLEPTPDEYVENMVAVFREVRRVLADHGTLWLNLGDSYASGPRGNAPDDWSSSGLTGVQTSARYRETLAAGTAQTRDKTKIDGLKQKDLCGIPWRVAFALQQPYYTGRIAAERDRVWLAAILDGEGTICGMRHVRPDGNVRTGCMTFITNTSTALLDECDRIWPGSRYSEKTTSEVSRPCWRWELQSASDRSALVRELYPYLIEKKTQALVAWNLLEIVQTAKTLGRGGETAATKEKRDYLVRLLSDLNARRSVDLPSWLEMPPGLYEPGWYLRSDVIWAKNNPMPESVTDRPTKAHEYVFLLSKRPRYWFDQEAVRETGSGRSAGNNGHVKGAGVGDPFFRTREGFAKVADKEWHARNVRSVWEIATQPYAEAHFATFPEELARRCILAGCPEWVCGTCGKPRERIVERASSFPTSDRDGHPTRYGDTDSRSAKGFGMPSIHVATATVGWSDCGHGSYRPGVVLDPFLGSGTTAIVARKHGRRCVGIELSPEYARLAAGRCQQLSLLAEAF